MKQKLILFAVLFAINFSVVSLALAQAQPPGFLNGGNTNPAPGLFANFGTGTFSSILLQILTIMMALLGVITMVFLILGAYYYLVGGANEDLTKKGKKMMTNAIIGFIFALLSYVILTLVQQGVRGTI